jgi:hypothetical protein
LWWFGIVRVLELKLKRKRHNGLATRGWFWCVHSNIETIGENMKNKHCRKKDIRVSVH